MSNLIDRQAAIDDIWTVSPLAPLDREWIDRWLRQFPPAQPERIRGRWISVTERLPEENDEYLCQEKQGFLYVDEWNGEYWECADSALGIVTAWMPLPEPYKEVTE